MGDQSVPEYFCGALCNIVCKDRVVPFQRDFASRFKRDVIEVEDSESDFENSEETSDTRNLRISLRICENKNKDDPARVLQRLFIFLVKHRTTNSVLLGLRPPTAAPIRAASDNRNFVLVRETPTTPAELLTVREVTEKRRAEEEFKRNGEAEQRSKNERIEQKKKRQKTRSERKPENS